MMKLNTLMQLENIDEIKNTNKLITLMNVKIFIMPTTTFQNFLIDEIDNMNKSSHHLDIHM